MSTHDAKRRRLFIDTPRALTQWDTLTWSDTGFYWCRPNGKLGRSVAGIVAFSFVDSAMFSFQYDLTSHTALFDGDNWVVTHSLYDSRLCITECRRKEAVAFARRAIEIFDSRFEQPETLLLAQTCRKCRPLQDATYTLVYCLCLVRSARNAAVVVK